MKLEFVIFTRETAKHPWTQADYARDITERNKKVAFYKSNGFKVKASQRLVEA